MLNKKLKKFKNLQKMFGDKAEEIAILKNKYTYSCEYDYIEVSYDKDDTEWCVSLFKRYSRCGDERVGHYYIDENEILSNISELEEKYKKIYDKKMAEKEILNKDKIEKYKIEKDKKDLILYEQLKEKFENERTT